MAPARKLLSLITANDSQPNYNRFLQDICLDSDQVYPVLKTTLQNHAWDVYESKPIGTAVIHQVDVTIKGHEDLNNDCSIIRFTYDEKLKFNVVLFVA